LQIERRAGAENFYVRGYFKPAVFFVFKIFCRRTEIFFAPPAKECARIFAAVKKFERQTTRRRARDFVQPHKRHPVSKIIVELKHFLKYTALFIIFTSGNYGAQKHLRCFFLLAAAQKNAIVFAQKSFRISSLHKQKKRRHVK